MTAALIEASTSGTRTEVEMAADAICALFAASVLPRTLRGRVAQVAGLTIDDLRRAAVRHDRHGYQPPRRDSAGAHMPMPVTSTWPTEAQERWRDGTARGRQQAAEHKSRQPKPGQKTMLCGTCGNDLSILHFAPRADRPGKRWTTCTSCRRERSRDRYLSVAKQHALNAARLTFVVSGDDESLGLACIDCGEQLHAGDEVEGVAQLRHTHCPTPAGDPT